MKTQRRMRCIREMNQQEAVAVVTDPQWQAKVQSTYLYVQSTPVGLLYSLRRRMHPFCFNRIPVYNNTHNDNIKTNRNEQWIAKSAETIVARLLIDWSVVKQKGSMKVWTLIETEENRGIKLKKAYKAKLKFRIQIWLSSRAICKVQTVSCDYRMLLSKPESAVASGDCAVSFLCVTVLSVTYHISSLSPI